MNRVLERCRERGYEPTLHCETGFFIESTTEMKVLELTDIDVCLKLGTSSWVVVTRWNFSVSGLHA